MTAYNTVLRIIHSIQVLSRETWKDSEYQKMEISRIHGVQSQLFLVFKYRQELVSQWKVHKQQANQKRDFDFSLKLLAILKG